MLLRFARNAIPLEVQNKVRHLGRRAPPCRSPTRVGLSNLRASGALLFALVVRHRFDFLAGLADIDTALEESTVFDADALGDNIAGQRTFIANVDTVGGGKIAAHFA